MAETTATETGGPASAAVPPGAGPAGSGATADALPSLADILAKRAAGEPLTAAEKGRLSWYGRRGGRAPQSSAAKPPARGPAVAGVPPDPAPDDLPPPDPADPQAVRVVCEAILAGIETGRTHLIATWAARIGADAATCEGFARRAAMNPSYRKVMVDVSPAVAQQLGIHSQNLPVWAFLGAMAMDSAQFLVLCRELQMLSRQLARDRAPAATAPPP